MRHRVRLQDAINDRYLRLADTDAETIDHQVALMRDWIKAQPELRAILTEAELAEPGLDFETWRVSMESKDGFAWPSHTEAGRAHLVWQLMIHIAAGDASGVKWQTRDHSARFRDIVAKSLALRPQNDYQVQEFVKQIFRPFFQYLSDQVGLGSAVVHVLQR